MRLIDRFRNEERGQATAWGEWAGEPGPVWAGASVSTTSSLQLLTVYGCVRLIADSIATLPLDVFRKSGDTKVEVTPPRWLDQPTPYLDRTAWLTQVLTSLLLAGNAYVWLDRSTQGGINQAVPLNPAEVQVRREKRVKEFWVAGEKVPSFQIMHIPAVMFPGSDIGLSPVEAARQSIGVGMAAQEHGARFFSQGASLSGVIETPDDLGVVAAQALANAWARRHSGRSRSHLPGVLTNGATWKPTGVTNEQAQFLQTQRYTAAAIAGQMFLLDPADIGIGVEGTSLTYANLEQRNLRRVQVTLLPWIVRLENHISSVLQAPRYVKFNVNGLLRADLKTRYESYAVGITNQFIERSEARAFEDLPPIGGIDDLPPPSQGGSDAPAF